MKSQTPVRYPCLKHPCRIALIAVTTKLRPAGTSTALPFLPSPKFAARTRKTAVFSSRTKQTLRYRPYSGVLRWALCHIIGVTFITLPMQIDREGLRTVEVIDFDDDLGVAKSVTTIGLYRGLGPWIAPSNKNRDRVSALRALIHYCDSKG